MNNWKEFIKKNWVIITLAVILAGAIFVRTYNFNDWLYFRADQVRDARLSYEAFYNGPGELPLLGPRAAGTFLRLGPVFYYFQYFSAKLFNSVEPQIFAYPDLFFSILTVPLLFVFLRNFFSRKISLLTTALYAFSFIIIQYSRFAWNPNSLPFWGLLFILSIYNTFHLEDKKKAGRWLILAGLAYAVASQLHFVALVGFPAVAFLFWIFYFPKKINWKYWLGALTLILILYIPVILSDVRTAGDSLRQFFYALTEKTGGQMLGLVEKCRIIAVSLFMFLTSYGHKESSNFAILGIALVVAGLVSAGYFWKKEKKSRPFIHLMTIWFFVFIALQIKSNISFEPRFFFPIAFLPFIFWGITLKFMLATNKKILIWLAYLSFPIILLMNFNGIYLAQSFLKKQDMAIIKSRSIFIKQNDAKTLGQMNLATQYMAEKAEKSGKIICFDTPADHKRSYEYIFTVYYPDRKYDRISKSMNNKENCAYFSIATAHEGAKKISNRYVDYFVFNNLEKFGQIAVWNIAPKDEFINYDKSQDKSRQDGDEKTEVEEEWEEVEDEEEDGEEKDAPRREERVFWKDVFSTNY